MTDYSKIHQPVLLRECVDLIVPALQQPGSIVVDCTLGLAGHALEILKAAPNARLIGIDRDQEALSMAATRLKDAGVGSRFIPVHARFDALAGILAQQGIAAVDAAFLDLGLSSLQIDELDRGFSYSHDAPLDMRMDASQTLTAQEVLATYSLQDLTRIFRAYGEERFAGRIAHEIVTSRDEQPIVSSRGLNQLVDKVVPQAHRAPGNPAKRVFQALRIEVNGELEALRGVLPQIAEHLAVGGRLVVESYHSLEDRTVKSFMREGTEVNVPPGLPAIPKDAEPYFKSLTRGAVKADATQISHNPRSSSVRLRAVELIRPIPQSRLHSYDRDIARDTTMPDTTSSDTTTSPEHSATTDHPTAQGGRP